MNNQQQSQTILYLKTLHKLYGEFEELTQDLSGYQFSEPQFETCVQKIHAKTNQIRTLETEQGKTLAGYLNDQQSMHPLIKPLVESLKVRIQKLATRYGEFEEKARESRAKLLPVVNEGVRFVKMKSAYARNSS